MIPLIILIMTVFSFHMPILTGGFVITNLSNSSLPWNTSLSPNITQSPLIVIHNMPWFFPFATLFFLLISDYIIAVKRGVDLRNNFYAVALAYTMLSYVEVAGSLSSTTYFFIFEFIMIIALFVMTLFIRRSQ